MRRLLVAILFTVWLAVVVFVDATSAREIVTSVTLTANTQTYSGPCPTNIEFVATVNGDPGTVIGIKFSGSGFPPSKATFGFIPDSGSSSIENDVLVDAAHAGTFERQVEITPYYGPLSGMSPTPSISSKPLTFTVTCVASPALTSSPGSSPAPLTSAAVYNSLNGVAVGDTPAPVLALLGLHPPGWAGGSPNGTIMSGEVREFQTDGGN